MEKHYITSKAKIITVVTTGGHEPIQKPPVKRISFQSLLLPMRAEIIDIKAVKAAVTHTEPCTFNTQVNREVRVKDALSEILIGTTNPDSG